jgi:hypothetical protein
MHIASRVFEDERVREDLSWVSRSGDRKRLALRLFLRHGSFCAIDNLLLLR